MIAFGCAITSAKTYQRFAEPGIRVAAEPDSEILVYGAAGSIFRNYNLLLDRAAKLDGLEALVLLHQDAEIVDPDFCEKVREALRDPEVALVGCAGAIGVRNIAWWQGSVTWASFTHHYEELGGGEMEALSWKRTQIPVHATHRRGGGHRRIRDGGVPVGGARAPLRRIAGAGAARLRLRLSASRRERPGARWSRRTFASSTTTR